MFDTILFVNGVPVQYKAWQKESALELHPQPAAELEDVPPVLICKKEEGAWQVKGTGDRNLIDQAIEDLEKLGG